MNDEEESGNVAPSTSVGAGKSAGAQPEWVLVPREPTNDMFYAGVEVRRNLDRSCEDIYRTMISAAPPAPSAWLPIESAPKDETWVLLWLGGDDFEPIIRAAFWSESGLGWFESEASDDPVTNFGDVPTHWMPLPGSPK